jgi:uncharacterized membrane protein
MGFFCVQRAVVLLDSISFTVRPRTQHYGMVYVSDIWLLSRCLCGWYRLTRGGGVLNSANINAASSGRFYISM